MSKGGWLILAAQFAPRFLGIGRSSWLGIAAGLIAFLVLFAWAAFSLFGWLWGQGQLLTERTPEAVRIITSQVERVFPGAREALDNLLPTITPEPKSHNAVNQPQIRQ